jgi:radical SAM superfamily enzyme
MFGLPGESKEDMLAEAGIISDLPLDTVKFHQLQLVKNTLMVKEFDQHPQDFVRFELDEYIDFFIDFLEEFNPYIVIERFAGEIPPWYLEQTNWGMIRNEKIWTMFEKRLVERDTWQGKRYVKQFEKRSR